MKYATFILMFSIIILLSSCSDKDVVFQITELDDRAILDNYINRPFRKVLNDTLNEKNLYKISLEVNRKNKKAQGELSLTFFNNSDSDLENIHFRLLMNNVNSSPMSIRSIEIDGIPEDFSLSDDHTTLSLSLKRNLRPLKLVNIHINYLIDFNIPPIYYDTFAFIDNKGFSIPHFFPVLARYTNGYWENDLLVKGGDLLSSESSKYFVEIVTDDKVEVIGSGKEIYKEVKQGKQKKVFVAGPVRDFYLCAFETIIPQVTISGGTSVISYAPHKANESSLLAAQYTSSAMSLFNSQFGVYPFNEIKIVSAPMTFLGVEFPGLFTIKEDLYNVDNSFKFESTIVHETAHQWFYSLIGNNQLKEPWLDESFSQYAMWFYYKERYGSSASLNLFNSFIERWEKVDRAPIPIDKGVNFYNKKEYSAIIYGRAPLFLLKLHNLMGEKEFHKFIRLLVKRYSHKILDTSTFKRELVDYKGPSVTPLLEEYFSITEEEQ